MINQLPQPTPSNLWAWLAWEPLNCSDISLLLLLCDVAQVFCFWPMTRMCVLSLWRLWSPPLCPSVPSTPRSAFLPTDAQRTVDTSHTKQWACDWRGGKFGSKIWRCCSFVEENRSDIAKETTDPVVPLSDQMPLISTRCAHCVILWYNATSIKADKTDVIKKVFPHAKATPFKMQQQD